MPPNARWVNDKQPKTLDMALTEMEQSFVEHLVDDKMDPKEAFLAAGYAESNANPRAQRLQRYLWQHIEKRIKERVSESARLALTVLENLMVTAESENVKLNAARDILSRAGYDAVHRQETVFKEVSDLTDEELDSKLAELSNVVKLGGKTRRA